MRTQNPLKTSLHIPNKEYAPQHVIVLARKLRANMTEAEKRLWERLKNKQLNGLRFRRQHPVYRYIIDFFCFEKKLAIELDGPIHSSQKEYDENRDNYLQGHKITILRFKNEMVMNNIDLVCKTIVETAERES